MTIHFFVICCFFFPKKLGELELLLLTKRHLWHSCNNRFALFVCALCRRLGFGENQDSKDPEVEVNDYLARAIDARSIDRLRAEHCHRCLLTFRKPEIEEKVSILFHCCAPKIRNSSARVSESLQYSKERDKMMEAYFVCAFVILTSILAIQYLAIPQ